MRAFATASVVLALLAGCSQTAPPAAEPTPTSTPPTAPLTPPAGGDRSETDTALEKNSVYRAGKVGAVRCELPTRVLASQAAIQRYLQVAAGCLAAAWRPIVVRSGSTFTPPRLSVTDSDASPCEGNGQDPIAFYCGEDGTITVLWDQFAAVDEGDQFGTEIELLSTYAHEYGHRIQDLVGILDYSELRTDESTGDAALATTRRMELQANCFGAAFLGANKTTLKLTGDHLWYLRLTLEDSEEDGGGDHGTEESNRYWTRAAFKTASPSSCNTWTADEGRVR